MELHEDGAAPDEGHVLAVLGDHDADVPTPADALPHAEIVDLPSHRTDSG